MFHKRFATFIALAVVLISVGFLNLLTPIPLYCLCIAVFAFAVIELISIATLAPITSQNDAFPDLFLNFFVLVFCGLGCWFLGKTTTFEFFLLVLVAFGCDTFAYLIGSRFGRRVFKKGPLKRSPSKTWEGLIAGVLCASLVGLAYIFGALFVTSSLGLSLYVPKAAIVLCMFTGGLIASVADMLGSTLKRFHDIKDSGTKLTQKLLSGHGGFIDRFLSLMAVTCLYALLNVIFS